jgi:hypothetical protein
MRSGISFLTNSSRNSERLDLYSKCLGDFIKFLEFVISNPNNTGGINKEIINLQNTIYEGKSTVEYNAYPNKNTKYKKCLDDSLKFLDAFDTSDIKVNNLKKLLEAKKKDKKKVYLPFIIFGSVVGGIIIIMFIIYMIFFIKINKATHRN